jgi:hypothetical protein
MLILKVFIILNKSEDKAMSYDLGFWKYKEDIYGDNQLVYEHLSEGEYIEDIEELPVEEILERIAEAFSSWERSGKYDFETEYDGLFQVQMTSQFVRLDCYGMNEKDMNKFIDIMDGYDCPLYDPQLPQRFDEE